MPAELHQAYAHIERQVDLGVAPAEPVEARQQPAVGERRLDADAQRRLRGFVEQLGQPAVDVVEAGCQLLQQGTAGSGQLYVPVEPVEQRLADQCFEFAHLAADGSLRDEQLLSGLAEAREPAGGLEAAQRRQRQSSAFHRIT